MRYKSKIILFLILLSCLLVQTVDATYTPDMGETSLDDAYNDGKTITVDQDEIIFDINDATNRILQYDIDISSGLGAIIMDDKMEWNEDYTAVDDDDYTVIGWDININQTGNFTFSGNPPVSNYTWMDFDLVVTPGLAFVVAFTLLDADIDTDAGGSFIDFKQGGAARFLVSVAGTTILSNSAALTVSGNITAQSDVLVTDLITCDSVHVGGTSDPGTDNVIVDEYVEVTTQPKFRAYLTTQQSNLVSGTWTQVKVETETFDIGSGYNTGTWEYTPGIPGYYYVIGHVTFRNTGMVADKRYAITIRKNNTNAVAQHEHSSLVIYLTMQVSDIIYLDSDDYLDLWALSVAGTNVVDVYQGTTQTYFAAYKLP